MSRIAYRYGHNTACPHCHARRGWRPLMSGNRPSNEFGMCFACGTSTMPGADRVAEFDPTATPYDPARRRANDAPPIRSAGRPVPPIGIRAQREVVPMSPDERAAIVIADDRLCPLVWHLQIEFDIVQHCRQSGVHTVARCDGRAQQDMTGFAYRTIDGQPVAFKLVRYGFDGHRLPGVVWIWPTGRALPLFGMDQLRAKPAADVVIVESEKTAVVCSYTMPSLVWLATGGASNMASPDRLYRALPLAGRRVLVLFDADAAGEKWTEPTIDVLRMAGCHVVAPSAAESLRRQIVGTDGGRDIADVFLQPDLHEVHT